MSPSATRTSSSTPAAGKGRGGPSHDAGSRGGRAPSDAKMDPRLSARRHAVHRAKGRRRLYVVVIVLGTLALLALAWFLLHTPLFGARSVTVTGAAHETTAQVIRQAGLSGSPPLIDVNAALVAARLEQLPWVHSVSVRVSWPDGVHIAVAEEVPHFVVASSGGAWTSLSAGGRVLASSSTRPPGLLLLGVPAPPGKPGTVLPGKDAAALRVAATLPPSFVAQVTAVTMEPAGWVQLSLTTPLLVDIGAPTQLGAKYEDVSAILAGATLHTGDVIDVSIPNAPTVTPGA